MSSPTITEGGSTSAWSGRGLRHSESLVLGMILFVGAAVALSTAPCLPYLSFPELGMNIVRKGTSEGHDQKPQVYSMCLFFLPLPQTLPLKELALRVLGWAAAQLLHPPLLWPGAPNLVRPGWQGCSSKSPLKCKHFLS